MSLSGPPQGDSLIEQDLPPVDEQATLAARVKTIEDRIRQPYYMAKTWLLWMMDTLLASVQASPQILKTVALPAGQHASIGATPIPLGSVAAGIYRVSYYARITSPDGVASSLTVALGWTESTIAQSISGAAMTGDSVTTVQTGSALIVVDASSAITYATTYTSNTPAKMQYRLTVTAEKVG